MNLARLLIGISLVIAFLFSSLPLESSEAILTREVKVESGSTRVYGLEIVKLPPELTYKAFIPLKDSVIVASEDYVAEFDLKSLKVRWAQAILGEITSLAVDSTPPSYVAVGTSLGEALTISYTSPGFKGSFYTATRAPVRDAYVISLPDGFRLAVLDSAGFLYVTRVVRGPLGGGWFEAGPVPHRGALTGVHGFKVVSLHPLLHALDWTRSMFLGGRLAALVDIVLPVKVDAHSFLGGVSVNAYIREGSRLGPAATGVFNLTGDLVLEGRVYYAVAAGKYMVPLPGRASGLDPWIYEASNHTITVWGLPPDSYTLIAFYESRLVNKTGGFTISSTCYGGVKSVRVEPGRIVDGGVITLEYKAGSVEACLEAVDVKGIKIRELYRPGLMQAVLLLNASRLPESFDYARDGKVVLLPVPEEVRVKGVETLAGHSIALLLKPGMGRPAGWAELGVDSIFVVGVGEWLLVYYLTGGFEIADTGYMQPQSIYLGNPITSVEVSPDASRIYVGLSSGQVVKLEWLRAKPWHAPEEPLRNRYYLDSALTIGSSPVNSIVEVEGGKKVVVTTLSGRIQVLSLGVLRNEWTPILRGPPGYEGLDTGLPGLVVGARFEEPVIALSPGTRDIYVFRFGLERLQPLILNVVQVNFREDGTWYPSKPTYNVEVQAYDGGALLASDRVEDGKATLFLPLGLYTIRVEIPELGRASANISIKPGFDERMVLFMGAPGAPLRVEVLEPGANISAYAPLIRPPAVKAVVKLVDVDGNPVETPVHMLISSLTLKYTASTVARGGRAVLEVPLGEYNVTLRPESPLYSAGSFKVKVTTRGVEPDTFILEPARFNVNVKLVDKISKALLSEQYLVKFERLELGSKLLTYQRELRVTGQATVTLPAGSYKITLTPIGKSNYEPPREVGFTVEGPRDVVVELNPKTYTLTARVKDPWGNPLAGAKVTLTRHGGGFTYEGETDDSGTLTIGAPYGVYDVDAEARWHKRSHASTILSEPTTVDVTLEPGLAALTLKYSPYILGALGAAVSLIIFIRVKRTVEEKLKEEYF